jgi:hypothetical protein
LVPNRFIADAVIFAAQWRASPRWWSRRRPAKGRTAPANEVERVETIGKDHRRFEVRMHTVRRRAQLRALPASLNSPPSPWSRAASSAAKKSRPNGDPISPPVRFRLQTSARLSEAILGHRKRPALVISTRTGHACAPDMAPRTWPWFATSPLILYAKVGDKRSTKRRRKCAAWDPKYLMEILGPLRH